MSAIVARSILMCLSNDESEFECKFVVIVEFEDEAGGVSEGRLRVL